MPPKNRVRGVTARQTLAVLMEEIAQNPPGAMILIASGIMQGMINMRCPEMVMVCDVLVMWLTAAIHAG